MGFGGPFAVEHVFYSAGFSEQEKEQLLSYLKRIQANCATITQA